MKCIPKPSNAEPTVFSVFHGIAQQFSAQQSTSLKLVTNVTKYLNVLVCYIQLLLYTLAQISSKHFTSAIDHNKPMLVYQHHRITDS